MMNQTMMQTKTKLRHFPGSSLLFDWGAQGVGDYAAATPPLDLRAYLNGPLSVSGMFFGLSGRAERRFTADMVGRWAGRKGTLEERFRYHDGAIQERCWHLTFADEECFVATAQDVEGEASGVQCGNAAVMRYRLLVPRAKGGEIVVAMEDWFYLMEDGTLLNRARMSKFGLKVGEVFAAFRKSETAA